MRNNNDANVRKEKNIEKKTNQIVQNNIVWIGDFTFVARFKCELSKYLVYH